MKKIILLLLVCAFMPCRAQSEKQTLSMEKIDTPTVDTRLWASWGLETIELTTDGVTKKYSLDTLLANKNILPRNMFTSLYFFNNQVGVRNTESEFGSNISMKGFFSTNNGELTITIYGKQPRTFTYTVENDFLKIWYSQGDIQLYLIYKLKLKNVR